MKYWEILLTKWRNEERDGFTIPFIIGSQKVINKTEKQTISELIIDIVNNSNQEIYIGYCINIIDLILGIRDLSKKRKRGYFPKYNKKQQSKLFVTNFVKDLGPDIETIIEELTNRYSNRILNKEFSINDRICGDYSISEKEFILISLKENYS